jgi:nucleoid DNA-binding protein
MAKDKPAAAGKANGAKPKKPKLSKSQFFQEVADASEMKKADVQKVFQAMHDLVHKHLGPKGAGEITMPGLFKLSVTRIKADKGGQKKPNPFKPGEFIVTKPKPARTKLKARGLKAFLEALTGK